jgi:hypothetical protein
MNKLGILIFVIALITVIATSRVSAQGGITVLTPHEDQIVQGVVIIRGTSATPNFVSSELDFAYSDDTTDTWFLISTSDQQVSEDVLANWDSTTITDGNYKLRLRVFLEDGSYNEKTVLNLRVRNYTSIDTPTPAFEAIQPTPTLTETIVATPYPTPTSLVPNPATLTQKDISKSIVYGGLGAVFLLLVLGIYLNFRWK